MPELERLVLHRLHEIEALMRGSAPSLTLHAHASLRCPPSDIDLSAFISTSARTVCIATVLDAPRKACLTVLDHLFRCTVVSRLAPMLCFTAEKSWSSRYGAAAKSVHLELFPEVPAAWRDDKLADKWRKVRTVRRVITGALESSARKSASVPRSKRIRLFC